MGQSPAADRVGSLTTFLVLWQLSFMLPIVVIALSDLLSLAWTVPLHLAQRRTGLPLRAAADLLGALISVGVFALAQWFAVRSWLPRPARWSALSALGVTVGNEIASRAAMAVIAASGDQHAPMGFVPLSKLVSFFFWSVDGVYAAYLLSTGMILGLAAGGAQIFALPFSWRGKLLWLIMSSLGGLAAVSIDAFVYRAVPTLWFDWLPKPFGLLPGAVLSRGAGVFLFGLLAGLTMHRMLRLQHRAQVDMVVGQFD